jgi:catechol 2,3-dioxygenase-like lactoylglutathione lyase family enzyme
MTISPVHHTNISVSDLERSIAFYRDALGYHINMRAPVDKPEFQRYMRVGADVTGEMAMLQTGDDPTVGMIELIQWSPAPANPTPPKRAGDPGPCMIVVEVKDETLEDVRDRLAALDIEPWSDIIEIAMATNYPPFRGMVIEDPDGTLIELIQLPTLEQVRAFRAAGREREAEQQPA